MNASILKLPATAALLAALALANTAVAADTTARAAQVKPNAAIAAGKPIAMMNAATASKPGETQALNPQPIPPGKALAAQQGLNPQPIPPGKVIQKTP